MKELDGQAVVCVNQAAMTRLARRFAAQLKPGSVCLLQGDLGSGKTFFTAAVCQALGVPAGITASPSYTIVNVYPRLAGDIYHVDLYRLGSVREYDDLGQEKWLRPDPGFAFIEWAERLGNWRPEHGFRLSFSHLQQGREVRLEQLSLQMS